MNTPRRSRRLAAVIIGLLAGTLALTGCQFSVFPFGVSPSTGPSTASTARVAPSAELQSFYDQQLDWGACSGGGECATVTAPMNWDDPTGETIDLAVARLPASSGSSGGAVLTNPGGPGASGVDFLLNSGPLIFSEQLRGTRDIVSWDPRGVGNSTPVRCLDDSAMDDFLYSIPDGERGSEEWNDALDDKAATYDAACEDNTGAMLEFITTEQSARDLDLLRAVLDQENLDYLGFSYGTFLGATYANLFPERTGHLVLDGAMDPSTTGAEVSITQAAGFENALRAYMEDCLTTASCPFSGTVDDGMSDLGALLASVDRRPLTAAGDDRELGADTLLTAIIAALYSQENWSYLSQALREALGGDATTAFFLADFYNGRTDLGYSDNSTDAFNAYNCMDYPDESDVDNSSVEAEIADVAPTIAPYWNGVSVCDGWPFPPTGVRGPIAAPGAAPIVVIGTTGDPATPYEWAQSLADQLDSGTLVTYEGERHTAYGAGSSCIDEAVDAFLTNGVVPDNGLRCT